MRHMVDFLPTDDAYTQFGGDFSNSGYAISDGTNSVGIRMLLPGPSRINALEFDGPDTNNIHIYLYNDVDVISAWGGVVHNPDMYPPGQIVGMNTTPFHLTFLNNNENVTIVQVQITGWPVVMKSCWVDYDLM